MTSTESISPCPECGGERVITKPVARPYFLGFVGLPIKRKFAGFVNYTSAYAKVGMICGYASLYAQEPQKLKVQ